MTEKAEPTAFGLDDIRTRLNAFHNAYLGMVQNKFYKAYALQSGVAVTLNEMARLLDAVAAKVLTLEERK